MLHADPGACVHWARLDRGSAPSSTRVPAGPGPGASLTAGLLDEYLCQGGSEARGTSPTGGTATVRVTPCWTTSLCPCARVSWDHGAPWWRAAPASQPEQRLLPLAPQPEAQHPACRSGQRLRPR